jgi:VWA domain containing CoxE-like protein.
MIARIERLKTSGVNVIVLLALSDEGRPSYSEPTAHALAAMDVPVFACTPDQFPDLMAAALRREDIANWAAQQDIKLIS